MEKSTKKKIAIGLGVVALLAVASKFLGKKSTASTAIDRMRADAYNPATRIGNEFAVYFASRGGSTQENIESAIAYHSNPANGSPYYSQYFG